MKYVSLSLAMRYIFRGSFLALLPVITVMLAVAFLAVIFSVANGLDSNLITKTISMTSHVRVSSPDTSAFADYMEFRDAILKVPGVLSAAPRFVSEVLVYSDRLMAGTRLLGIIPELENRKALKIPEKIGKKGIILGDELFKKLLLKVGDQVTVKGSSREEKFTVEGTFSVGIYDYDASYMLASIDEAGALSDLEGAATEIVVEIEDPEKAGDYAREIAGRSGARAESWQEMNRDLLVTIRVERFAMFAISVAAIFISTLSIAFLSITNTFKRQRDIGILKALGASNGILMRAFIYEGFVLGMAGLILGIGLSWVLCDFIAAYKIPLPPEAATYYSVVTLPVIMRAEDIMNISALVMFFSILSSIPCLIFIFRMNPAEIMRKG